MNICLTVQLLLSSQKELWIFREGASSRSYWTYVLPRPRQASLAVPALSTHVYSSLPFPPDLGGDFVHLGLISPGVLFQVHFRLSRFAHCAPLPTPDSALPVDSFLLTQKNPSLGPWAWHARASAGHARSALTTLLAEHSKCRAFRSGFSKVESYTSLWLLLIFH